MRDGALAAQRIRDCLNRKLALEELLLRGLLAKIPDEDVPVVREAVLGGLQQSVPHLVFGMLEHPEPAPGRERVYEGFPPHVRWARGVLASKFRRTLRDLASEQRPCLHEVSVRAAAGVFFRAP
ncbi:hypothetical protein AB0N88_20585 [Streptomyces sp. NPDC093516]|uniref:hypothetical protein n=1 Tax=Streptomyces sp. NPDC093516 TaxID=3155304 RepID=UPI003427A015